MEKILIVGHADHGKIALTHVIEKSLSEPTKIESIQEQLEKERGIKITNTHQHISFDTPLSRRERRKNARKNKKTPNK